MDALAIRDVVAARRDGFIADLEEMVNVDSGSFNRDGVNRVATMCERRFRDAGWEIDRIVPADPDLPPVGDTVVGTLRGTGGPRVLLLGHTDTVFDDGVAAERPFSIADGRAFGPGVSDMKGGLVAGFVALEALRQIGFDRFDRITYVCNSDEEIGSPSSRDLIRRLATEHDAALVLECGRANGDIVSARKGVVDLRVIVHGRAAHAGVEPERGRSATLQAAHAIIALHALNGRWPGVTVNVGVIQGGTRPNVVTERCELHVDLRAPTAASFEEARSAVEEAARARVVPDTETEVITMAGFPPMEKTEATARLVEIALGLAEEIGFDLLDAATGGASDANPVAGLGVPTLDGLGPVGGADHAPGEWVDLDSVVPRMTLLAGLIARTP